MAGVTAPSTASSNVAIVPQPALTASPTTDGGDDAADNEDGHEEITAKAGTDVPGTSVSDQAKRRPKMCLSGNVVIVDHASGGVEDNAPRIDSTRVNSGYYEKDRKRNNDGGNDGSGGTDKSS